MGVRGRENIITIGLINYIVAAVAIAPYVYLSQSQYESSSIDLNAVLTGGSMGLIYFIAFFFVIYCVRVVGASSSTVVGSLSLLIPIIVAAIVWASHPNLVQIGGIVLALASLIMVGVKTGNVGGASSVSVKKELESKSSQASLDWIAFGVLSGFFLLCGLSRVSQEAFKYLSVESQKPVFLIAAFVVAATPSLIMLLWRRLRILKMEWFVGIIMGLSNGLQTFFILKTLDAYPGYVAFPVTSAGGIVFTTLVATQILGEKLSPRAYVGIGVAVVALFLLNWGG